MDINIAEDPLSSLYDKHYLELLSRANESKIALITLHIYIASIASLQANAPLVLDRDKVLHVFSVRNEDVLVLLVNHTGYFETEQFSRKLFSGVN